MRQTSVRYDTEALYRVVSYFANAVLYEEGGGIGKGEESLIVVPSVQVAMVRPMAWSVLFGGIFYSQTPRVST
jgi:hypothetical protein